MRRKRGSARSLSQRRAPRSPCVTAAGSCLRPARSSAASPSPVRWVAPASIGASRGGAASRRRRVVRREDRLAPEGSRVAGRRVASVVTPVATVVVAPRGADHQDGEKETDHGSSKEASSKQPPPPRALGGEVPQERSRARPSEDQEGCDPSCHARGEARNVRRASASRSRRRSHHGHREASSSHLAAQLGEGASSYDAQSSSSHASQQPSSLVASQRSSAHAPQQPAPQLAPQQPASVASQLASPLVALSAAE